MRHIILNPIIYLVDKYVKEKHIYFKWNVTKTRFREIPWIITAVDPVDNGRGEMSQVVSPCRLRVPSPAQLRTLDGQRHLGE